MAQSLSLIPSQHCYPAKHTNLNYLEQIMEWFRKTVTIADRTENVSLLPLQESLQQSFQSRIAHSARDLVFMFICILRGLGVKARLIMSLQPLPLKPSAEDLFGMNKTRKNIELGLEEGIDMKVEKNDTRDTSEATTSKKSLKEENKFLKDKKSKTASKFQDEKQGNDNHKKNNKKSSNSNLKSKTPDVKKPRNDADMSEKKMQKLQRTLRARKETVNMYRDKTDSSDEGDTRKQYKRVACKEQQRPKIRITSDRQPHNRPATDRTTTGQQETLSKERGSGSKTIGVNTKKKRNLSQIASSLKQDENSDSDFVPESSLDHKSCNLKGTESGDSSSESDFKSKKATQKKATNRKVLDRGVLVSDSGTSTDGKGTKKKKKKKNHCDVWSEVFLEEEEKWISVDVQSGKLHCVAELYVSQLISFAQYVGHCMILDIIT
jgi:hypothetical protein